MSKSVSVVENVKNFWSEVVAEIVKCEWPSRRALMESTVVVIVTVALLSLFIGVSDKFLVTLFERLTPTGM